jgi:ribosome biogenesis GTPase
MLDIIQYGYTETQPAPQGLIPARIAACHRDQYDAVCRHGEVTAVLKGSLVYETQSTTDYPCVGDFVYLDYNPHGPSRIVRVLPRRSLFERADLMGHKVGYAKAVAHQVVAVNFDYVFIVSSLNKDFRVSRITRYLTQARHSGGSPVVLLTKADLVDDPTQRVQTVCEAAPGVPVHAVSAHTGQGMEALHTYLAPAKTIVFLGMSGVGKSSLLNALKGEDVMAVKDIREDDSRGRHTTTHRQLVMLAGGAMVIDTPGMRELGLIGAEDSIRTTFARVEDWFAGCRFSDCTHEREPGCAVRQAIADGHLLQSEWDSYLAQMRENRYADDRMAYVQQKSARNKSLAIHNRKRYKKK